MRNDDSNSSVLKTVYHLYTPDSAKCKPLPSIMCLILHHHQFVLLYLIISRTFVLGLLILAPQSLSCVSPVSAAIYRSRSTKVSGCPEQRFLCSMTNGHILESNTTTRHIYRILPSPFPNFRSLIFELHQLASTWD